MKQDTKAYIDTSILVAYYCPESLSSQAEAVLSRYSNLAISWLVDVEFVSAVSKKVRRKELKETDGIKIVSQFFTHLEKNVFESIRLTHQHYRLARDWIGQFKLVLRTLDALHLAIAQLESCKFITADSEQAAAGKALGLDVTHVLP